MHGIDRSARLYTCRRATQYPAACFFEKHRAFRRRTFSEAAVLSLFVFFLASPAPQDAPPVDLSAYDPACGVRVERRGTLLFLPAGRGSGLDSEPAQRPGPEAR
jgi:hypothetical protein